MVKRSENDEEKISIHVVGSRTDYDDASNNSNGCIWLVPQDFCNTDQCSGR